MPAANQAGERDGAAVRIPPPLVYATAILGGVLLQRFVLELDLGLPVWLRQSAAIGATCFGVGLIVSAMALFWRTGQAPEPWKSTPEIVERGPYQLTRNPMYLGMGLFQGAVGLGLANGWILLSLPVVAIAVYWTAIRHEEDYLERKFGASYLEYKSSVRRWF